jgi:hypothetical protein
MSNHIVLEKIEIKTGRGEVENGFRFYDDYSNTTRTPLEGVPDDDLELLKMVVTDFCLEDGGVDELIDHLIENKKGLEINDVWYDFSEIKKILSIRTKQLKKKS